jgi:DNA adenine methylase
MLFALREKMYGINDISPELVSLYRIVGQANQRFFQSLEKICQQWTQITIFAERHQAELQMMFRQYATGMHGKEVLKEHTRAFVEKHSEVFSVMANGLCITGMETRFCEEMDRCLREKNLRMVSQEEKHGALSDADVLANLESALKQGFYNHARHLYNNIAVYEIELPLAAALFFFVRDNAYAAMFRYNSQGKYNAPYGGLSYNHKDLARKATALRAPDVQQLLSTVVIENLDFEEFLRQQEPGEDDFIFFDPPYISSFSTYAQHVFDEQDHQRLARYLSCECKARWMLVIKNTPVVQSIYQGTYRRMTLLDTKYLVTFQGRNRRETEHLILTNY